jgi:hypothetical protein
MNKILHFCPAEQRRLQRLYKRIKRCPTEAIR